MFPKRRINNGLAREYYQDGSNKLGQLMNTPPASDMSNLASALDSHFAAIGASLNEFRLSIDMLFERIDNLERRLR